MPAVLTAREEEIIKTVAYYRYMTARDLTNLLFAKTSITWMRGLLAELAGKDDLQTHHYLCRFTLPSHGQRGSGSMCWAPKAGGFCKSRVSLFRGTSGQTGSNS